MPYALLILTLCLLSSCGADRATDPGSGCIAVHNIHDGPYLDAFINGKKFTFLIDTGATAPMISAAMVQELGLSYSPNMARTGSTVVGSGRLPCVEHVVISIPVEGLVRGVEIPVAQIGVSDQISYGILPFQLLVALHAVWDFDAGTIRIRIHG